MLLPVVENELKGEDYVHFSLQKDDISSDNYDTLASLVEHLVRDGYRGSCTGSIDVVGRRVGGGGDTPAKTIFSSLHSGMLMQCNPTCNVTVHVCRSRWCTRLHHHPRHGLGGNTTLAPHRREPNLFGRAATSVAYVVRVPVCAHPLT